MRFPSKTENQRRTNGTLDPLEEAEEVAKILALTFSY
jgi:hypothetical protein